jgi:hypothetical protein
MKTTPCYHSTRNIKGNMPSLVTCPCQNCNGKLEFDPATLSDENKKITCPHCSLETILFVPPPADAKMEAVLSVPAYGKSYTVPNRGSNFRLRAIIIGVVAVVGLFFAGAYRMQKQHVEVAPDPEPPITGAFGWTFGQKIPESIDLKTDVEGSRYQYVTSTNPPFETIIVSCTEDRTIYSIWANTSHTNNAGEYYDLTTALRQKYGHSKEPRKADAMEWVRPAAERNVEIDIHTWSGEQKYVSVLYTDLKLSEVSEHEYEQRHNAKVKPLSDKL